MHATRASPLTCRVSPLSAPLPSHYHLTMARAMLSGTATVVSAREDIAREGFDDGEASFAGAVLDVFKSTAWELELEVRPDGQSSYRVSGQFRMPNRVHKIRKTLSGPPQLAAGVVLPVAIDAADPQRIEILWKELVRSGGMSQLYGEQFSARELINDFRDAVTAKTPAAPSSSAPASPRPTAKTFPPIDGVDFDTYIAAVLPVARGDVQEADLIAHYEASGFPIGRVPAIATAWAERTAADPVLDEWYGYLTQT